MTTAAAAASGTGRATPTCGKPMQEGVGTLRRRSWWLDARLSVKIGHTFR